MLFYIRKYYFFLFLSLALFVYSLQQFHVQLPKFVMYYLNDLLCMPIVLHIIQKMVRYIKSNRNILINGKQQIAVTILYITYFESILPIYNERYTGDYLDVGCYILGCFIFYLLNNHYSKQIKNSKANLLR